MNKQEIFEAMAHNAMGMLKMAESTGDKELAIVAHSTLVALVAVKEGDTEELAMMLSIFCDLSSAKQKEREAKKKEEIEKMEMPEEMKALLDEIGINFKKN